MKEGTPQQEIKRPYPASLAVCIAITFFVFDSALLLKIVDFFKLPDSFKWIGMLLLSGPTIGAIIYHHLGRDVLMKRGVVNIMAWMEILALAVMAFVFGLAAEAGAYLASLSRLEWIVIIAGFLVWRELAAIRRLIAVRSTGS